MSDHDLKSFSDKHGSDAVINASVKAEIEKRATDGKLPCAVAFKISEKLDVSPSEVGKTVDLINFRLVKCQLGLFGYSPEKKIVKPAENADPAISDAIKSALTDNHLTCKKVWQIALDFNVPKLRVSSICETIGVKIRPCQLGAF
ncbi:MAG: hypothetical protein K9L30_10755 [Desulfobacterales bacterium]|nr:hypothetical protein [Desulfobacterales bacterium]